MTGVDVLDLGLRGFEIASVGVRMTVRVTSVRVSMIYSAKAQL